jgi:endonuclease YncB( thermonuclease family)
MTKGAITLHNPKMTTRSRLVASLSALAVGALVVGTLGVPVHAAATVTTWHGLTGKDVDGDTVWVDIAGDGKGPVLVRNAGIQAMETGTCHAADASALMKSLTAGKKVTLSATVNATNGGRPVRYLDINGSGLDPQLAELNAGLVMAENVSGEAARGHAYQLAMERAAARGKNLWDKHACGAGPQQAISTPDMWVKWDLDMSDFDKTGVATENVKVRNTSKTMTLNLSGWFIRDGSHYPPFTFPRGTTVAPDGIITLYTGAGKATKSSFFWNREPGAFTNPKSLVDNSFGALYLEDPQTDIRAHVSWPCVYKCPAVPALKITHVEFNPPGDDFTHVNREYISIQTTGGKTVALTKVVVTLGGHVFHFGPYGVLKPGQVLRLHSGTGRNTALTKYWQYSHPLLNNSGTVRLRTAGSQPITCTAWGTAKC